jgi:hypothetical protein
MLFHFRYYRFICKACGKTYARSLSPFLLGTGRRKCPKCGAVFCDGFREWPELGKIQRFEYVFPTTVLGYFGGIIVVLIAVLFMESQVDDRLFMSEMVFLLMIMPWAPYFMGRAKRIRESIARFERHRVFGDTDESILSA